MAEQDTVRLLRECDAGIKMGISSIEDVEDYAFDQGLKDALQRCKAGHQALQQELEGLLEDCHDQGKDPNPMAVGMSWIKTNVKLALSESDHTIADLISDGCSMGSKSLGRYLNQYKAASGKAKDLCRRLIAQEDRLGVELRVYL